MLMVLNIYKTYDPTYEIMVLKAKPTSKGSVRDTELSETQNYAYWYAHFFPGTHDFRWARVPRTHVFLVGTR